MKKAVACFTLFCLFAGLWGTNVFAEEFPLGDLGNPDDYDQTIQTFSQSMSDFDIFVDQLPPAFNWNDEGIVTPAKNQGSCGSCWAFASAGALESKILMMGGPEYDFSEQQQVSCNISMSGCCGGNSHALKFWYEKGPMEQGCTDYEDYTRPSCGSGVLCDDLNNCSKLPYKTAGYYTVNTSDINEIKASIHEDGPAYFRYDVYSDFFTFWNAGSPGDVYTQSDGSYKGGHAVLIIGWDDSRGTWLCKNSWGATGGPDGDGTFRIAYSGHASSLGLGMANVRITGPVKRWIKMESPTSERLLDVWGSSGSDVFAVGNNSAFFHYDGSSWSERSIPSSCWSLWGNSGSDLFSGGQYFYHYDGSNWETKASFSTLTLITDIWGSSENNVFAVDYHNGYILHYDGNAKIVYRNTSGGLWGIWGSSESNVFAVGMNGAILHYNGTSWTEMTSPTSDSLLGVWGNSGSNVFAVGENGTILHYNGTSWTEMTVSTSDPLVSVWGSSESDIFAVGGFREDNTSLRSVILHYDGTNWEEMPSPTSDFLWSVWGSSGDDVFAAGDNGTILHYAGTLPLPDLTVENPDAKPLTSGAGSETSVSCTIKNQGSETAGSSTLKYYLSGNATYQSGDIQLGFDRIGNLSVNETGSESNTLTIPADTSPGPWYILFCADANEETDESNEDNNCSYVQITVEADPDMTVQNPNANPATLEACSEISVSCVVGNQGMGTAGLSALKYYLSEDTTYQSDDTLLNSDAVGSLSPAGTSSVNAILTIPCDTSAGTWYVLFCADADGQVAESDEENNCGYKQITVETKPDMTVQPPDANPAILGAGSETTVSCTVKNQGAGTAGASSLKYYLSEDTTYQSDDTLLSSDSVSSLSAGGTGSETKVLTIPADTSPGIWYILFYADADNQVAEKDESNNIAYRQIEVQSSKLLLKLDDLSKACPDDTVSMPIALDNPDNEGIQGVHVTIGFDKNLMEVTEITQTGGILNSNYLFEKTIDNTNGQITMLFSATTEQYVTGSGKIADIEIRVVGNTGEVTSFSFAEAKINDASADTKNGSVGGCADYDISGTVAYSGNEEPVPNVTLTLTDGETRTAATDAQGDYLFNNISEDNYISAPSKDDDFEGLSSLDASKILQYILGKTELDCHQMMAADVNRDKTVTVVDASKVAICSGKRNVGVECRMNDEHIDWLFTPDSIGNCDNWPPISYPSERTYQPLNDDKANQDFVAILLGDVTKNWPVANQESDRKRSFPKQARSDTEIRVVSGDILTIPVALDQETDILGVDIVVQFDKSVLNATGATLIGGILESWENMQIHTEAGGLAAINIFGSDEIKGSENVAFINFDVVGSVDSATTLSLTKFECNEATVSGGFDVNNTVAAQVTVTVIGPLTAEITSSSSSEMTNLSPIPVTVTFSRAVTGFDASDIVTNGTVSDFEGSGTEYTFNLAPLEPGLVTVDIHANATEDTDAVGNTEATRFSLTYIDLQTAVLILKALAGINGDDITLELDVNKDGKLGTEDVVYILNFIAGLRQAEG
ncbi:MAG: hypothetical protein DRI57_05665 [Deltaproteobacteria bacterium]|nr:MAG: hypothetical protein DRI57_05665 [Deltaproteobacteria bacterium]